MTRFEFSRPQLQQNHATGQSRWTSHAQRRPSKGECNGLLKVEQRLLFGNWNQNPLQKGSIMEEAVWTSCHYKSIFHQYERRQKELKTTPNCAANIITIRWVSFITFIYYFPKQLQRQYIEVCTGGISIEKVGTDIVIFSCKRFPDKPSKIWNSFRSSSCASVKSTFRMNDCKGMDVDDVTSS